MGQEGTGGKDHQYTDDDELIGDKIWLGVLASVLSGGRSWDTVGVSRNVEGWSPH